MTDVMKKNWTPSLRSTEESIVNQNSFRVLSILYITNFCETRKINSNAIQVLFRLLISGKVGSAPRLGALKIIFPRGCSLNN